MFWRLLTSPTTKPTEKWLNYFGDSQIRLVKSITFLLTIALSYKGRFLLMLGKHKNFHMANYFSQNTKHNMGVCSVSIYAGSIKFVWDKRWPSQPSCVCIIFVIQAKLMWLFWVYSFKMWHSKTQEILNF